MSRRRGCYSRTLAQRSVLRPELVGRLGNRSLAGYLLSRRPFVVALAGICVFALFASAELPGHRDVSRAAAASGIHKIRHVVIVMQENRSFDSYFGTYPGADGIPVKGGKPHRLLARSEDRHLCVPPYHDASNRNTGGPHDHVNAVRDINGGKMNGFHAQARRGRASACKTLQTPNCTLAPSKPDVMGYHDAREIPNYWSYAQPLRAPGPHVRAGDAPGACRRTCTCLGLVGALHEARAPNELQERAPPRRLGRRRRAPTGSPTIPGPTSRTSCTATT